MKKKTFETSFKKLYLITPAVYERILASMPKPEVEQIRRLNANPVSNDRNEETEVESNTNEEKTIPSLSEVSQRGEIDNKSGLEASSGNESIRSDANEEIISKLRKIESELANFKESAEKTDTVLPKTSDVTQFESKTADEPSRSKNFICEICGKRFANKYSKNRHVFSAHERIRPEQKLKKQEVKPETINVENSDLNKNERKRKIEEVDQETESSIQNKLSKSQGEKRKKAFSDQSQAKKNRFDMWT